MVDLALVQDINNVWVVIYYHKRLANLLKNFHEFMAALLVAKQNRFVVMANQSFAMGMAPLKNTNVSFQFFIDFVAKDYQVRRGGYRNQRDKGYGRDNTGFD